jgi:hypothetical protein
VARAQQDVLRLDVAVDHAVLVGVLERVRGFPRNPHRLLDGKLPLSSETVAQGLALDKRHGQPELARVLPRVVHPQDVGVLEPGGEPDLALEAFGAERDGEIAVEDLERHRAIVAAVVREVHRGHAAAAELALDAVALGERRAKPFARTGQRPTSITSLRRLSCGTLPLEGRADKAKPGLAVGLQERAAAR